MGRPRLSLTGAPLANRAGITAWDAGVPGPADKIEPDTTSRTPTMSALAEFLFPAPARRTVPSIFRWWEARRIRYNVIVGVSGVTGLGIARVITQLPPEAHSGFPMIWQPIVIIGVLANLCYLLGPVVEAGVEKFFTGRILPVGPALFRMGLTFSVGLAFLPVLATGLDWGYRILRAIL